MAINIKVTSQGLGWTHSIFNLPSHHPIPFLIRATSATWVHLLYMEQPLTIRIHNSNSLKCISLSKAFSAMLAPLLLHSPSSSLFPTNSIINLTLWVESIISSCTSSSSLSTTNSSNLIDSNSKLLESSNRLSLTCCRPGIKAHNDFFFS